MPDVLEIVIVPRWPRVRTDQPAKHRGRGALVPLRPMNQVKPPPSHLVPGGLCFGSTRDQSREDLAYILIYPRLPARPRAGDVQLRDVMLQQKHRDRHGGVAR